MDVGSAINIIVVATVRLWNYCVANAILGVGMLLVFIHLMASLIDKIRSTLR